MKNAVDILKELGIDIMPIIEHSRDPTSWTDEDINSFATRILEIYQRSNNGGI